MPARGGPRSSQCAALTEQKQQEQQAAAAGSHMPIWSCSTSSLEPTAHVRVELSMYVGSLKTLVIVLFTRNVLLKRHGLKQRDTRQPKGLHHLMLFGPCIHPDMCLT
jgi:hypothetical protein